MRTLAIGDIHGCYSALETLLEQVQPVAGETLVFLGDYIDRGPDSRQVLELLQDLQTRPNTHFLRGNHELMLLWAMQDAESARSWVNYGGIETLDSFGVALPAQLPPQVTDFLENTCRPYWENATHIFVHASVDASLPMEEQPDQSLYWNKFSSQAPHFSGKSVVCGHTAQKSGSPRVKDHAVCIDTWVYGKGWLTCLDVSSGRYWQANRQRQTREGDLAALNQGLLSFLPPRWRP